MSEVYRRTPDVIERSQNLSASLRQLRRDFARRLSGVTVEKDATSGKGSLNAPAFMPRPLAGSFTAATAPSSFPDGWSYFTVSGVAQGDGWPVRGNATGYVENHVMARGGSSRIRQYWYPKVFGDGIGYVWVRTRNSTDTAWNFWVPEHPIVFRVNTATDFSNTLTLTFEDYTAGVLTISDLPDFDDCNYTVSVVMRAQTLVTNTTSSSNVRHRIRISPDNGATWFNGQTSQGNIINGSAEALSLTSVYSVGSLQPTADLLVRPQVYVSANIAHHTWDYSYLDIVVAGK